MKFMTTIVAIAVAGVSGQQEFWEGFSEAEHPFEHDFKDIPDIIDKQNV